MSKIDKIIQILHKGDGEILGLSESGVLYKYNADHTNGYTGENYPANWESLLESPVVDNSPREDFEQELRRVELEVMEDRARIRTTQDAVNHILDKGA